MLLLLARHPSAAATLATQRALASAQLQGLTSTLREIGADTGDYLRSLWPESWSGWMAGPVSLSQVAEALALLILLLATRWVIVTALRWVGAKLRSRKVWRLNHRVADVLFRTLNYAFLLIALFVSVSVLELPTRPLDWQNGVWRGWLTLLLCFAAFIVYRLGYVLLRNLFKSWAAQDLGLFDDGTIPLLRDLLRVTIFIVALIAVVEIWGYNATTLLAGVGLGGLAVAFAAQDTISNVFGSLIIYLDRPFRVGEWIKMGEMVGSIEEVGIRSTRLRLPDKTPVMVPNKRFTTENIVNYTRMTARRINTKLCLSIGNSPEKLEEGLGVINSVLLKAMEPTTSPSGVAEPPRLQREAWFARLSAVLPTHYEVTIIALTVSTDYTYFQQLQEELLLEMLHGLQAHDVALARTILPTPDSDG